MKNGKTEDGKQKKKLEAKKDLYRLRVGDFRVFYTFGPTWVRLLGVRRKNERTYGDRIDTLAANDIGRARLRLAADLPLEPYRANRASGSFLVIHPSDGATLAAGIVRD